LGETVLLDWPDEGERWFVRLDDEDRLAVLAHVVQSAADGDAGLAARYARRAEKKVRAAAASDASLRLQGATARAFASFGDYEAAASHLEAALEGWRRVGEFANASYALSELLRLRGIGRDLPAVERLGTSVAFFRSAGPDTVSRVFVGLAFGRALIQAGALDQGSAQLSAGRDEWKAAPQHAAAARRRWLHYVALQRDPAMERKHLTALRRFAGSAQLPLALIDAALTRGEVVAPLVQSLVDLLPEGAEAARSLARLAPHLSSAARKSDRGTIAKMAWEYRY
jgi:hypothetical protein